METVISFSTIIIAILFFIIKGNQSVIQSDSNEWRKIITLTISNFVVYCLALYCYGFIQWTIRLDKFYRYPYRNPFNIIVIICCIIFFIVLGIWYVKYRKKEYGITMSIVILWITHILAILLIVILQPFRNFF